MAAKKWNKGGPMRLNRAHGEHIFAFPQQLVMKHSSPLPPQTALECWLDVQEAQDEPGREVKWCWLIVLGTRQLIYEVSWASQNVVLKGGRVFVRTYLIAIYHTTTSLSTFCCTVTSEVDTKHGEDAGETVAGKHLGSGRLCLVARGDLMVEMGSPVVT